MNNKNLILSIEKAMKDMKDERQLIGNKIRLISVTVRSYVLIHVIARINILVQISTGYRGAKLSGRPDICQNPEIQKILNNFTGRLSFSK